MTRPADLASLFRDVVAAGTRHQRTLADQTGGDGLVFHCEAATELPPGVVSPYADRPDEPGAFLVVAPAGPRPAPPAPGEDGLVNDAALAEHESRVAAWQRHRDLYNDLFAARTPAEHLELVVGVGRLDHVDADGVRHQRHVVTAPASIELDQRTQRLTVTASDAFRVEHNWIEGSLRTPLIDAADSRIDAEPHNVRSLLDSLVDSAESYSETFETWALAVSVYGQDTRWESQEAPPVGVVSLSTDPVVLLRRKDTSHLLALLTEMADDLNNGGHVSGPLRMLADITAPVDQLPVATDRPALPRPANDDQRQMLELARKSRHVVIQGPPGTGKTHTIANLVAVLLAEGRRVLVTAENDRALREVQGKLPLEMQPLLLPLLKDKANSGLSRSVSALVEAAGQAIRGGRPDREPDLRRRLDELERDAAETIQRIRDVDARESREHDLNGQRMRLAGHLIALDERRDDLATAYRYLTHASVDAADGRILVAHYPVVTQSDRELARLRLPAALPAPEEFAQNLHETKEQLVQLPAQGAFDLSSLDEKLITALSDVCPRLGTFPPVPYASIDKTPGEYSALATETRASHGELNHGVTVTGATGEAARDWLSCYLDLPSYYRMDPASLFDLYRRTSHDTAPNGALDIEARTNPVATHRAASDLLVKFTTDPTGGLLTRYVSDLRTRGNSRLTSCAQEAQELAFRTTIPPTLPIVIADGAPADHELLEQATGLRDHLAGGGSMTRKVGPTPRAVKTAQPFLSAVTVGGSVVNTVEEAEAAMAWLNYRLGLATARNWAAQHDLPCPDAAAEVAGWLSAVGELPAEAKETSDRLDELLDGCSAAPSAATVEPDELVRNILTAASGRIQRELVDYHEATQQLAGGAVKIDGVPVHDEASATTASRHLDALATREGVVAALPRGWFPAGQSLHDVTETDRIAVACDVAAVVAGVPGAARPETLSEAGIAALLERATTDRRREEIVQRHETFLGGIRTALAACTPASPATQLLRQAVDNEAPAAYRDAHAAHVDELGRADRARALQEATDRVTSAHPSLVTAFTADDDEARAVLEDLGRYQDLIRYREATQRLLGDYPDIRELHEHLGGVRSEAQRVEAQLSSERCWSKAAARLAANRDLASALSNLQKAERAVPKTKTAKTYQRKLRALREATKEAAPAIPCWVMPIEKVAELLGYPATGDRFDVVIVDEASQAWFPTAFLYAIAEQVVIVGDDLQTSPAETSVTHDAMVRMVEQYIPAHRLSKQLDGEFSLYDVAASITAPQVMTDHFRCVPPVIELSNQLCYAQRGQRLLPVRASDPAGLDPIRLVHVTGGTRTSKAGANRPEIDAVVRQVASCVADPAYKGKSFGVVVVGPNPDAHTKLLRTKLLDALGGEQLAARQIEVGSPAQYQGAERDVMFLSLVAAPDDNGNVLKWTHELTGRNVRNVQKLNVAVSRARDQLWIFHSFTTGNLKPGDVRHVLLAPPAVTDDGTVQAQLEKCESQFERDVLTRLSAEPTVAKVRTQVEALGYRIDIVIEDHSGRRLAVECDGDRWHTDDGDVARDLYRQRTLEIMQWRFHRFLASEWYADPEEIVAQTVRRLLEGPAPAQGDSSASVTDDAVSLYPGDDLASADPVEWEESDADDLLDLFDSADRIFDTVGSDVAHQPPEMDDGTAGGSHVAAPATSSPPRIAAGKRQKLTSDENRRLAQELRANDVPVGAPWWPYARDRMLIHGDVDRAAAETVSWTPPADELVETLTCAQCGDDWEREQKPGRKPQACPACETAPSSTEWLLCGECGTQWERAIVRGRKPRTCPDCSA